MNRSLKLALYAISILLVAFYFLMHRSTVCVIAIYDPAKVGEMNMVKSTTEAFSLAQSGVEILDKPNAKSTELKIDQDKVNFVVTAGQFCIDFLKTVKPTKNVKFLLCVHQWFDAMKELHDVTVAMPKHAINDDIKIWAKTQNIQIIPTQGVLHRMSKKAINSEDTSMIQLKDAKVGIVLGGDAEMPNGKDWKLFSEENAHKFGLQVGEFLKKTGYKVLITNGPRTGAFKDANNRDPNAHKNGRLDKISEVFLKTLADAGFIQGEHFEFFDFQFGKPSALKAIMAVVSKNKGFLIVPGESISSISEATAIMPTVVYKVDSMNEVHQAYLDDLANSKVAFVWPDVPGELQADNYVAPESQAVTVVKVLLQT